MPALFNLGKEIDEMKPIGLSILVVNCKDYKPMNNWYLCKSGRYLTGAAKSPDSLDYDVARLKEYDESDDYVLMPECPGMADEEAAAVVRKWCEQNDIPYMDDIDDRLPEVTCISQLKKEFVFRPHVKRLLIIKKNGEMIQISRKKG